MDVRTKIRDFIIDNFMMGRNIKELGPSDSLLEMGIIDSTGILELVSFIEENYQIRVEDEELVPENLDSIDHLVNFIQKKKS